MADHIQTLKLPRPLAAGPRPATSVRQVVLATVGLEPRVLERLDVALAAFHPEGLRFTRVELRSSRLPDLLLRNGAQRAAGALAADAEDALRGVPQIWLGERHAPSDARYVVSSPVKRADMLAALERAIRDADGSGGPEAATGSAVDRATVLLVDGSLPARVQLERALAERLGRLRAVGSAEAARDAMPRDDFGLAVIVPELPDGDGYTLSEELLALARGHGRPLRVLMLSSGRQPVDAARARRCGVLAVLSRPIRRQPLLEALGAPLGATSD